MRDIIKWDAGFTLIEMIVVLTVMSILALMAAISLRDTPNRAHLAAMQSDLRNVANAQEAYVEQTFSETGTATYANSVSDLGVNLSNGVQVALRGDGAGWSAQATHPRVQGKRCAVYRGTVQVFPPATQEGTIACD